MPFAKSSQQSFLRGKKTITFETTFSKAETEECNQEDWKVFNKF